MNLDRELKATLDTFSPVKVAFVARVMESLANPPNADIREHGTWLTGSEEWIEFFGLALSVHHSATWGTEHRKQMIHELGNLLLIRCGCAIATWSDRGVRERFQERLRTSRMADRSSWIEDSQVR